MKLPVAYHPNYYSIDDILATQERTPCKFNVNVPKLGNKLNPSAEENDIKSGAVLELPMWLTQELGSGRYPIATPSLPKVYKEAYREILKADPCAVDLYKFGLYFYELGLHARRFDPNGEVGRILVYEPTSIMEYLFRVLRTVTRDSTAHYTILLPEFPESIDDLSRPSVCLCMLIDLLTFQTRFRQLMDLADNSVADPSVQSRLDMLERYMFRDAHEARTKLDSWLRESQLPLEAATMVMNHKKRKRVHMDDDS